MNAVVHAVCILTCLRQAGWLVFVCPWFYERDAKDLGPPTLV